MPRQNLRASTLPAPVLEIVRRLGENLAIARKRRGLSRPEVLKRTGLAPLTYARVEQGNPTTSIAAYVTAAWALGLEGQLADLLSPDLDEEGKTLERARLPKTVRPKGSLDADF